MDDIFKSSLVKNYIWKKLHSPVPIFSVSSGDEQILTQKLMTYKFSSFFACSKSLLPANTNTLLLMWSGRSFPQRIKY